MGMQSIETGYGPGDEIADYTIVREIGHGGFSRVYEATSNESDQTFALKIVDKPESSLVSSGETMLAKLDLETTLWSRLHHPHILEMIDVIHLEDATIIVSELASQGSLLDYIPLHGAPGMSESKAQRFFYQICTAIDYLHNQVGLIHRDIKCDNILIDWQDNVKLADFGLATDALQIPESKVEPYFVNRKIKSADQHPDDCHGLCCVPASGKVAISDSPISSIHLSLPRKPKLSDNAVGSLHYCAPEHLAAISNAPTLKPKYNPSSDMWSLGCVLYTMLTGSLPFSDSFVPRLQISIMNGRYDHDRLKEFPAASEIVRGLLTVDPSERWTLPRVMSHPWVRAGATLV
ncbi:kinase-like domain-containing protein [Gorgonomyces haynaldii]|nr:kinase-like domain-containing protein [Gorgonomyces haynaldii]